MAEGFNWLCPYCEHAVTITSGRHYMSSVLSEITSDDGTLGVRAEFTTCPNENCKRTTVEVVLGRWGWVQGNGGGKSRRFVETLGQWRLKPWGRARSFPDCVPAPVRSDYEEAHSIVELSPKAAATLARRAVQGIVRDYWKVVKGTLKGELDAVEKMVGQGVDPQTWQSLRAVRELGNIGAHPERDINLIVDVEAGEAELLLKVVETLIDDTYIARSKREEHYAAVEALRQKKTAERTKPEPEKTGL